MIADLFARSETPMALERCRECGKEISTDAARCPNCGARNSAHKSAWSVVGKVLLVLTLLVVAFLGYGCLKIATDPDAAQRADERDAIASCEAAYERAKEDPRNSRSTIGVLYGACESKKADFRRKWGRNP